MPSVYKSAYLSLREAVELLRQMGVSENEARGDLVAALRDGKLSTQEWVWDDGLRRFIRTWIGSVFGSAISQRFDWSNVIVEDIDWGRSSVAELRDDTSRSVPFVARCRVDMLEISRGDFTKLWDPSMEPSGLATDQTPDSTKVIKERRGRKKGDGSYDDSALLIEMEEILRDGKAKSSNDAAGLVADRAAGNATFTSKQKRLHRKYQKKLGILNPFNGI